MAGEEPETNEDPSVVGADAGETDAAGEFDEETLEFTLPSNQGPLATLETVAPVLLFVVLNARFFVLPDTFGSDRFWFATAVIASVGWSLFSIRRRKRQGLPVGRFIPIVTGWLVFRGLIGVITGNEQIFFALSIAAKVAIGLALLGTVVMGRSFAGQAAPWVFGFSPRVQAHPSYISGMAGVTVIAAVYEFLSAIFDWWLLFVQEASANEFVLIRYVVNWGASTVAVLIAYLYIGRRLREIEGFPGLTSILERQVEAYAEKFGLDLKPEEV